MQTISLPQLQEMFASLRTETDENIDGEMLWGYYFTAAAPEVLESLAETLEARGFDIDEIFQSDDEPIYILQAERFEKHTPESLFALNAELETVAGQFAGVEYDGMDVNPADNEDDDECGCTGGDCDCESEGEEAHECCGGKGGESCCGGKHCHSESEPITNPQILAAIERIAGDRSEDAQQELTLALQRGLFLVPVFTGRIDTEPTDDEAVQVLVCTDEKNDEYLPLFTDEAALKAWTDEDVAAMVLTAPEAWEFIVSQPECAGGVVNPGAAALPLSREMVGLLKKMIDDIEGTSAQ